MKFIKIIQHLQNTNRKPLLAVLIDPDKFKADVVLMANKLNVSCFLVGGSKLLSGNTDSTVKVIKQLSKIPVVLFPGDETQLTSEADGLLLPGLLSGRNPDYLIGKQVLMAPIIRAMKLPSIPLAYLLIEGNKVSSTEKVTKTKPLIATERKKIIDTALAAELLGYKALYLEAGSGASKTIPARLIRDVKKTIKLPVIVGGGINSKQKATMAIRAGADMVVVGNALEKDVYLLTEISSCFK